MLSGHHFNWFVLEGNLSHMDQGLQRSVMALAAVLFLGRETSGLKQRANVPF